MRNLPLLKQSRFTKEDGDKLSEVAELEKSKIINEEWKLNFVKLMCDIETCGFRATGLTLVDKSGKIDTLKHDTNATKFFEMQEIQSALMSDFQTMIGHCRFPTKGDAKFPVNNHPFTFGNTTIVHQGVLSNDEELKKKYNFTPEGETDSWIIVHLIEMHRGAGKSVIDAIALAHEELKGSWGVALVDHLEPEKLYLFCHDKSFKINYYPEEELFMFSTENFKLDKFNTEITNHFGHLEEIRKLRVAELKMKDEECVVIGGEKEVEVWTLPEPEKWWGKKNKRFGDSWGGKEEEDRKWWKEYYEKQEKEGNGRRPYESKTCSLIPAKEYIKI